MTADLDICPSCWREHPDSEPCTSLAQRAADNTALLAREAAERLTAEACD
jgi:hypothetical protein